MPAAVPVISTPSELLYSSCICNRGSCSSLAASRVSPWCTFARGCSSGGRTCTGAFDCSSLSQPILLADSPHLR